MRPIRCTLKSRLPSRPVTRCVCEMLCGRFCWVNGRPAGQRVQVEGRMLATGKRRITVPAAGWSLAGRAERPFAGGRRPARGAHGRAKCSGPRKRQSESRLTASDRRLTHGNVSGLRRCVASRPGIPDCRARPAVVPRAWPGASLASRDGACTARALPLRELGAWSNIVFLRLFPQQLCPFLGGAGHNVVSEASFLTHNRCFYGSVRPVVASPGHDALHA